MTEQIQDTPQNNAQASTIWDRSNIWVLLISVFLFVFLIAGAFGYFIRDLQMPGENSADVGFARDMSDHHRQAVEMAALLYDRTDDDIMRILAYDILTTQQAQIGIMSGWLDVWGHNWFSTGPRMKWMGMSITGLMPGMATREELNQLVEAEGEAADALFMQLMIPHHRSGVLMAEAAVQRAKTDIVRDLAQGMADAQQNEIAYMQQLLQEKGYDPVPEEPMMDMDASTE